MQNFGGGTFWVTFQVVERGEWNELKKAPNGGLWHLAVLSTVSLFIQNICTVGEWDY
jgi:hypothetical protein